MLARALFSHFHCWDSKLSHTEAASGGSKKGTQWPAGWHTHKERGDQQRLGSRRPRDPRSIELPPPPPPSESSIFGLNKCVVHFPNAFPVLVVPGSANNLGRVTACLREVRRAGTKVVVDFPPQFRWFLRTELATASGLLGVCV